MSTNSYSVAVSNKCERKRTASVGLTLGLAWELEKGCPASSTTDSPCELKQLFHLLTPLPSHGRMELASSLILL